MSLLTEPRYLDRGASKSLASAVGQAAFSGWLWGMSFATMGVGGAAGLLLQGVVPDDKSHKWFRGGPLAMCLKLAGCKLEILEHPDYDQARPAVYVMNHTNLYDGHAASAVIPQPFCGLMNHWHFNIPGYGHIMRAGHSIPVYPKAKGRTEMLTREAKQRAEMGLSILTFPEAHRTRTGRVGPFKRGVFFMARDAGLPIVPLALRGMYEVNHKGTWLFKRGVPLSAYLGPHIETAGLSDDDITALAAEMQELIAGFVERGDLPEGVVPNRPDRWGIYRSA